MIGRRQFILTVGATGMVLSTRLAAMVPTMRCGGVAVHDGQPYLDVSGCAVDYLPPARWGHAVIDDTALAVLLYRG